MVEVLIEEMYGSDGNRLLDYERAMVVKAEKKDNLRKRMKKTSFKRRQKSAQKQFDRADILRHVR